ncbi:MAG: hypothetical protein M3167_02425 [Acidobacteriota bacterium]|nr:hypothetical protein [Acidobacteriota bacterium]
MSGPNAGSVADTSRLIRVYFDNSHWNNLFRHSSRDDILRSFARSRQAVFPSVINAAELLNTSDAETRRQLCAAAVRLLDARHTVLDHPDFLLAATADAFRRRQESVIVREGPGARALRSWIERPDGFGPKEREIVRDWTDELDLQVANCREALDLDIGDTGFVGDARALISDARFAAQLFEEVPPVREAARSAAETFDLIRGCSAWAAFAGSIAYEFSNQPPAPHRATRPRLPEGSDMAQIIYLGFVNVFVTDDRRFRRAVEWVSGMLPRGVQVDVLSSSEYFTRLGGAPGS